MRTGLFLGAIVMVCELLQTPGDTPAAQGFGPGARVLIDAHNCYPYHGRWADRITRTLAAGLPVAIEQDLAWYTDPRTGRSRSLLSHEERADGTEPDMRGYFFERKQERGHSTGKTDPRQRAENQHPVKAAQHALNLNGVPLG